MEIGKQLMSSDKLQLLFVLVTDIQCTFASGGTGLRDSVAALLRKPEGFRGAPLFADDRATDPVADPVCQIRPEPEDPTGLLYRLRITDFSRCGVLKRNGFVHVRVWFPQFPGVVMQSDQELIIMCKPPEPTIIENKAAGFAGSFPTEPEYPAWLKRRQAAWSTRWHCTRRRLP